jgi:hypothetical protein
MGSCDPFRHFKHKLWPKEKPRIKLTIYLVTIKSWESPPPPDFLAYKWSATYCWKALDQGYNLALDFISIGGLHTKLWAPKVARVPIVQSLGLGSPGTKWNLGASPMAKHIVYYKGEGGDFPQVWAMVNLVSSCLPLVHPCTKVLQLRTNQLIVWFVQVCVSKWNACQSS